MARKEGWDEITNRYKYGDKVIIEEPFYAGLQGTIVGRSFSDGYDCTVFDGWKVKLDDGKEIITHKLKNIEGIRGD